MTGQYQLSHRVSFYHLRLNVPFITPLSSGENTFKFKFSPTEQPEDHWIAFQVVGLARRTLFMLSRYEDIIISLTWTVRPELGARRSILSSPHYLLLTDQSYWYRTSFTSHIGGCIASNVIFYHQYPCNNAPGMSTVIAFLSHNASMTQDPIK